MPSGSAGRSLPEDAGETAMVTRISDEETPEWLPDGWIMEVRRGQKGHTYRYYTCPESDLTFCSREEVLWYLNREKVNHCATKSVTNTRDGYDIVVQKVKDLLDWLPRGWIMEIRIQNNGPIPGYKYKCYFDESTGLSFSSKEDVLLFLKAGKRSNVTSAQERCFKPNCTDFVLARIEYSPDGLPCGWLRVVKFRASPPKGGTKSDLFLADPASGYAFRSMRDALNFVNAGIVPKLAFRPRIKTISHLFAFEQEFLGANDGNRIDSDKKPNIDTVDDIEHHEHLDLQCSNSASSPYIISDTEMEDKDGSQKKRKKSIMQIYAYNLEMEEKIKSGGKKKRDIRACEIL